MIAHDLTIKWVEPSKYKAVERQIGKMLNLGCAEYTPVFEVQV